jgi:hypothetical protein
MTIFKCHVTLESFGGLKIDENASAILNSELILKLSIFNGHRKK